MKYTYFVIYLQLLIQLSLMGPVKKLKGPHMALKP